MYGILLVVKKTAIFRQPSFVRGMSRVFDLFGHLDAHQRYFDIPDTQLTQDDWEQVGKDLELTINNYGHKSTR